jgi:hypothetical protein
MRLFHKKSPPPETGKSRTGSKEENELSAITKGSFLLEKYIARFFLKEAQNEPAFMLYNTKVLAAM